METKLEFDRGIIVFTKDVPIVQDKKTSPADNDNNVYDAPRGIINGIMISAIIWGGLALYIFS